MPSVDPVVLKTFSLLLLFGAGAAYVLSLLVVV